MKCIRMWLNTLLATSECIGYPLPPPLKKTLLYKWTDEIPDINRNKGKHECELF